MNVFVKQGDRHTPTYMHDPKLTWKAKGLIAYIMSLPSDWILSIENLKNVSKDSRDATATGLRELIKQGYCRREDIRRADGTFIGFSYQVSDTKLP